MKEIPMLFSTPMVQALLDGRKTMTRRLKGLELINMETDKWTPIEVDSPFKPTDIFWFEGDGERIAVRCPYGQPGDLIYVRETWGVGSRPDPFVGSVDGFEYKADEMFIDEVESLPIYPCEAFDFGNYDKKGWRPSIHMPKIAARLWLQVTDIRVKRLQDISEEDAKAEGVKPAHCDSNEKCPSSLCREKCSAIGEWWNYLEPNGEGFPAFSAKESFETLWQSIDGPESWAANPWVWCISFNVISTTGHP